MGLFDNIRDRLTKSLQNDIAEQLNKGDADQVPQMAQEMPDDKDSIGRRSYLTDPYFDYSSQQMVYKVSQNRISKQALKDTSIRDWLISAIIQARCDTMLRFARPQRKNLEMGFKVYKRDAFGDVTDEDKKIMQDLEDFFLNCGRKEGTPPGEEMLFGEFLKLCTRDAMTFGNVAVEKVLTMGGALHRFRPVPADSMFVINERVPLNVIEQELKNADTMRRRLLDESTNQPQRDQVFNDPDVSYYKYVQMSKLNQVLSAWGDEDMVFMPFNVQNFSDLNGYCYGPLELAIINATRHLNVETYNANFFTNGYAARGVLHLKGTVTPADLNAFRRQFYNTINGTQNAWRTPIVAGMDEVQWVPISGTAKEMEYLNYNNHLMRSICSQFQIDPVELGLDYLVTGTGRAPAQQANNEYKINYSRERGLIPLLMLFEDMVNSHLLPAIDKELAQKYEFRFTGYDEDSPQVFVANLQAEMSVYSTLNDLFRAAGKTSMNHAAANLPLNQTFWALIEKNMTRGEIREYFFGDAGASKRPELSYIPADPAFLSWRQLLITIDQQKQMQEQQQQQAQMQQQQLDDQKQQQINEQAHNIVHHQNLRDTAKQFGATGATHVGGTVMKNPMNTLPEGGGDEEQ